MSSSAPEQSSSDWVSIGRAASLLGVNPATLRHWTTLGKLHAYRTPGGHRRYSAAELTAFAEDAVPEVGTNGHGDGKVPQPGPQRLSLVGDSHHTAPVDLRERLAFPDSDIPSVLRILAASGQEALILSTCNRTELYLVSPESLAGPEVLAQLRGLDPSELEQSCYCLSEEEAVRHLLRVASGLDSMVIGETQILGQVRDAFEVANTAGTTGRVLGRVLPLALEVGKRARSETAISRRALSPSSVAVELARRSLGELASRTALVLGAGEAGRATARSLKDAGVARILVANRTADRGIDLAKLIGGEPIDYGELETGLAEADIVIASTGASDHVLTADLVRRAVGGRVNRTLFCIDIAMPRDIDPEVGLLDGVILHNIDDLEAICEANLRDRASEIASVETLVEDGLADFREWRAVERLVPTIGALYQRAEGIRRAELERTIPRLRRLSEEDRELIDVMTASIVRRLLHTPVAALKAHGRGPRGGELAELTKELFALAANPEP